jgi:hypothetical protein
MLSKFRAAGPEKPSMPHRIFLTLVLSAALTVPASAQFAAQSGHWTVLGLGKSCMAINRPMAEFNASPWNSLALVAQKEAVLKLQVWFWPGYAASDANPVLNGVAGGDTIEKFLSSTTIIADFALETAQPLPEAFMDRMRDGSEMVFSAANGASLTFDATGLGAVLDILDDCRSGL